MNSIHGKEPLLCLSYSILPESFLEKTKSWGLALMNTQFYFYIKITLTVLNDCASLFTEDPTWWQTGTSHVLTTWYLVCAGSMYAVPLNAIANLGERLHYSEMWKLRFNKVKWIWQVSWPQTTKDICICFLRKTFSFITTVQSSNSESDWGYMLLSPM